MAAVAARGRCASATSRCIQWRGRSSKESTTPSSQTQAGGGRSEAQMGGRAEGIGSSGAMARELQQQPQHAHTAQRRHSAPLPLAARKSPLLFARSFARSCRSFVSSPSSLLLFSSSLRLLVHHGPGPSARDPLQPMGVAVGRPRGRERLRFVAGCAVACCEVASCQAPSQPHSLVALLLVVVADVEAISTTDDEAPPL